MKLCTQIFLFGLISNLTYSQCEALFSWDDTDLTIQFSDESAVAAGDQIISWFWDFDDDDATSNAQNPQYTFSEPDKYDVTLTIVTANGCTSEIEIRIEICNFSVDIDIGDCADNDSIPIIMVVRDVYDSADEFDLILDGQVLPGGPYEIEGDEPVFLNIFIAGDGLMHELVVQSTDVSTCNSQFDFTVPDCSSDCFLSSMQLSLASGVEHTVLIGDNFFEPVSLTTEIGDVIIFDWVGDGHSSTSDATTGTDSWDSGVIGIGSTFELSLTNPGLHRYYCEPHGGPGGTGMAASIIANCPLSGRFELEVNFNALQRDASGYNLYLDNALVIGSPFSYNNSVEQNASVTLIGDGLEHLLLIEDVADPTCSISKTYLAPDCGAAPPCSLEIQANISGGCNNGMVPVNLVVAVINGGTSGFNVFVDGNLLTGSPFLYDASGTTTINAELAGDGLAHNIQIIDAADPSCSQSTDLITTDCSEPCVLSDLQVSTQSSITHVVEVEDFQFVPKDITISVGDVVQWEWVGQIPHTATSDATSGPDSWDSGLLGFGERYTSPVLGEGSHPYYCIPHGGPGGVGMAGTITVVPACDMGLVSTAFTFTASGFGFSGYNVFVDNVLHMGSPYSYDSSGQQTLIINLPGDGQAHNIRITDVEDISCTIALEHVTPDCNPPLDCELMVSAIETGPCENERVPVEISVLDSNGGTSGFNVFVDGNLLTGSPFLYDASGTTTINAELAGDGLTHNIQVIDAADPGCSQSSDLVTTDCSEPCVLSDLQVSTQSSITHIIDVEDFQFSPKDITISVGDVVQWEWVGQIPHTATSDATSGPDSWDSGLLGFGERYTSPVLGEGSHPYYCIPHGGPGGVGMAGTITVVPACDMGLVSTAFTFTASGFGFSGYNVFVDNVLHMGSPYSYDSSGQQTLIINLPGDGQAHNIRITDVEDISCTIALEHVTPDCDPPLDCELMVSAIETGPCENERVPVEISVLDSNGGTSGFNVFVDGNLLSGSPFLYDASGTTTINAELAGDGLVHNIQVIDAADPSCSQSIDLITTDCSEPCVLSDLQVSTQSSITHVVEVEDFQFAPKDITIAVGDVVQWEWVGQIPHTATSDATSGADSWDSGLLGFGEQYTSPVLSEGFHPYYCIPHGGPGGVGMAGTITVVPDCDMGLVSTAFTFTASGFGFSGYNVFVDDVLHTGSPYSYDPSGQQTLVLNLPGDGRSHNIRITDVEDAACTITIDHVTPDCNPPLDCELLVSAIESGPCVNDRVPVELSVQDSNGGSSGFNVFVDGSLLPASPFHYDASGTTTINTEIAGDGLAHNILIIDSESASCSALVSITTSSCNNCLNYEADFQYQIDLNQVSFIDLSSNGSDEWIWGFGDGNISIEQNPTHTYIEKNTYTVCLLAKDSNSQCLDDHCEEIVIESTTNVDDVSLRTEYLIYPNPVVLQYQNYISIESLSGEGNSTNCKISLFNMSGQLISSRVFLGNRSIIYNLESLSKGMYILAIEDQQSKFRHPIIII